MTLSPQRLEKAAEAISLRMKGSFGEALFHDEAISLAHAAISAYLGDIDPWKEAENCIPTNWCDSLLTGPDAPRGPLDCPAVEKLLLGIIKRIREKAALSAELTERDAG